MRVVVLFAAACDVLSFEYFSAASARVPIAGFVIESFKEFF